MSLKTKVKAGNITNLSDARYCSGMGVEWLGFPLRTSHLEDDIRRYKDIASWTAVPGFVLELHDLEITTGFLKEFSGYNAGWAEISVHQLESIAPSEIPLMVMMNVNDWPDCAALVLQYQRTIRYIVLYSSGLLHQSADLITGIASEFDVLLKLSKADNDLPQLLDLPVKGFAIMGNTEERPGITEYTTLSDVLEKLEID